MHPMGNEAMRTLADLGKASSLALSWPVRQLIEDAPFGTVVVAYPVGGEIAATRSDFGDFDRVDGFGPLLFAAKAEPEIVDLPIRHRDRTNSSAIVDRQRHCPGLVELAAVAAPTLRFA